MKFRILVFSMLSLTGCCANENSRKIIHQHSTILTKILSDSVLQPWSTFIKNAASYYDVDERLISAIISVESGGNPDVISRSNAVGLMQIKASTAGREVYRAQGRYGQPNITELRNPVKNINIGTFYIRLLQTRYLAGIHNPEILRYATIIAYADGIGTLLRTFSFDRYRAIAIINTMSPEEFQHHVKIQHPDIQAIRYLRKVNTAYHAL